ncbi:MAG TPA: hydrogenase maturation protease [Methanomassiliicoccales archaeon]|nr:hydrogenase maturation protease [Euryarchaeota archaeon]HOO04033.1 hydrogenase maturation protease [Methanomassiliicoccales archaeon]HQM67270.1 hydrogenase maturation protease [Methanomassiliicoccales archaeon]HRR66525.1 hydrogenase maturation protease [Methanomassiliicoccales archaeon]HRU11291.1 hydrogenase maturation protease [Methanomassiliicoccales archaeon]
MKASRLLLGIGSPIVCDDGLGFRVVEEVRAMGLPDLDVDQQSVSGLDLIEIMMDYKRVVVVDAIVTGRYPAGTVMVLEPEDFKSALHGTNPHEVNIHMAIELGRRLSPERMPRDIRFVAMEVKDVWTVSDALTEDVERAVPLAVRTVLELLGD